MKNKILIPIVCVAVCIIVPLSTLLMPFSATGTIEKENNEYVLKDVIKNNDSRIVDIALLGAHDAFSNHISTFSQPDKNDGALVNNWAVRAFAGGLVTRMSKAQSASAKDMLYKGVRYFDVRVTEIDNEFYTMHGFVSDKLSYYLQDVVDYLDSHNGEYVILDIQHFYTPEGDNYDCPKSNFDALFSTIDSIKNSSGKSIFNYVNYDSTIDSIGSLTYGKVTNNGTQSGVVLLAKTDAYSYIYSRDGDAGYGENEYKNIRSYWQDTNSDEEMMTGINKEVEWVKNHDYSNIIRVNQLQKTGMFSSVKIISSLFQWSIMDMAYYFNGKIISDKDTFNDWLNYLPIVMVDNVTSTYNNFNKLANEYIKEFNLSKF